ncbi:hypothetical protein MMH89_03360 [Candidatus Comchoanobacter bicostacola]|uniref:Uncharacterized protein n=1 Tax=Candidatus Comchoanobacter bicostacola TaxID=2919598 RepID=A0ABY5DIS9_9GAMM|nr:hypothetical protein [Candidatus Comchoanobacter bicostacola]UTC24261.1 hypothetical protein MMH89_03360 [Candidatus Comchoanobacter bicostacola]
MATMYEELLEFGKSNHKHLPQDVKEMFGKGNTEPLKAKECLNIAFMIIEGLAEKSSEVKARQEQSSKNKSGHGMMPQLQPGAAMWSVNISKLSALKEAFIKHDKVALHSILSQSFDGSLDSQIAPLISHALNEESTGAISEQEEKDDIAKMMQEALPKLIENREEAEQLCVRANPLKDDHSADPSAVAGRNDYLQEAVVAMELGDNDGSSIDHNAAQSTKNL